MSEHFSRKGGRSRYDVFSGKTHLDYEKPIQEIGDYNGFGRFAAVLLLLYGICFLVVLISIYWF